MLMERHGKNVSFTFLVCANLACKAFWMSICILFTVIFKSDLKFFSLQFSGTDQHIIAVHFHCFQAFYLSNS